MDMDSKKEMIGRKNENSKKEKRRRRKKERKKERKINMKEKNEN